MKETWNPPKWLREKIEVRDKKCVYCETLLKPYYGGKGKNKATLEHIENRPCVEEWNICLCCNSCNSSKGTKDLFVWIKEKNVDTTKFAPIIKEYLKNHK